MAENGRKNFKNIEENGLMALGQVRLMAFHFAKGALQTVPIPGCFWGWHGVSRRSAAPRH